MKNCSVRWSIALVLAVLTLGIVNAGSPMEDLAKEREKYAGTWKVTSVVVDGRPLPDADCHKLSVINQTDGVWSLQENGKEIFLGTSTIDPTKLSKTIDFTITKGKDAGKRFVGIYELATNTRKLCFVEHGHDRPTEIASNPGSGRILVLFERRDSANSR